MVEIHLLSPSIIQENEQFSLHFSRQPLPLIHYLVSLHIKHAHEPLFPNRDSFPVEQPTSLLMLHYAFSQNVLIA